jgi:hypothetical protein
MSRITISLKSQEKIALHVLAEMECRDPRSQAILIIRQELERRGLLQAEVSPITVLTAKDPKQESHDAEP